MKLFAAISLLLIQSASAFSYLNSLSPNGAATTATTGTSYAPSSSANGSTINGAAAGAGSSIHPHVTSPSAGANTIGPSEEMLILISRQVSVELMASQAYMAASIWFRARNMDGMAAWMLEESDEERGHGKEILEFALKNHYPVKLEPLAAPQSEWSSPAEVWETILGLEQQNTRNLLNIAQAADACGMYGVKAFLDPFHVEQIEAEDKVGGILAKIQGASDTLMWELDHALGLEAEEEGHH